MDEKELTIKRIKEVLEEIEYVTFVATVLSAHRIQIPKNVWKLLGLEKGDYVEVKIKKLKVRPPGLLY